MSSGPVPSTLVLLPTLHQGEVGDKVRFLGCVKSYATSTATLTLEHDGARAEAREPRVRALVDLNLVLQNLKSEQVRAGEWVNVIGYVSHVPARPPRGESSHCDVHIQAIVLWSAGPLNLQDYETAVAARATEACAVGNTR